jgi:hypothetical protein
LGLGQSSALVEHARAKVQWAYRSRGEVKKLRDYLNVHIGTINMLLVRQGLVMLDVATEQSDKNQQELKKSIEVSSTELREVRGDLQAQALSVKENRSMIKKLFRMIDGDIVAPMRTLIDMVARVWYDMSLLAHCSVSKHGRLKFAC